MWQYDLDIWPWNTKGIFLLWWSILPSCMILELTVHSISCLLCDKTTLTFDHRLWNSICIILSSCWSYVPSCKIPELTIWHTSPEQTDRWITLYHNTSRQRQAYKNCTLTKWPIWPSTSTSSSAPKVKSFSIFFHLLKPPRILGKDWVIDYLALSISTLEWS